MTVVTRFAPSPTGFLHIGGARTALFCWLYARHTGGKFLLRIEDTDHERNSQAAIAAIFDGLSWLGLDADEPPVMQSSRAARHAEIAEELVKRGKAYRAYETPEELEEYRHRSGNRIERLSNWHGELLNVEFAFVKGADPAELKGRLVSWIERAAAEEEAFKSDFKSPGNDVSSAEDLVAWAASESVRVRALQKHLSKAYRSPYRDAGKSPPVPDASYAVRLRMPDAGSLTVADKVQGDVTQLYENLDDLVLLRSNGTPTYMLAVVVDDHDMGVTQVIRGDDHLTNTFRQIPIFDGMGWTRPHYAHVPLIHGPDGKKLSKRHGAQAVHEYRDMGYLPEGLKNYLLRLGWSHGDAEIIPEAQAIVWFDVDGLNKAPARLDFAKLDSVNAHYMAQADDARLTALFFARPEAAALSDTAKTRIAAAMPHLKTRAATIAALAEASRFLGDLRPIRLEGKAAALMTPEGKARLAAIAVRLESLPEFSEPAIKEALAQYCAAEGIGLGKVGPLLRAALTSGAPSPDITLVMALLGRGESLARLKDQAG